MCNIGIVLYCIQQFVIKDHFTVMWNHIPYGSHSVTCHLAAVTFPPFTPPKAGTRSDARLSCPRGWLYPKIVYLRNTVRNNWAVSWLGIEPMTKSHKSDVLTTRPPSHRLTQRSWFAMSVSWLPPDCQLDAVSSSSDKTDSFLLSQTNDRLTIDLIT